MKKGIFDWQGLPIAYTETAGTGQPVLLIHGNSANRQAFARQLESGLGETFRLIAPDLPGHGDSGPAGEELGDYSISFFVAALVGLCHALECADAVLVGHSLGGHLLLEAAPRLPAAKGIMILGTPPLGKPPAVDKAFVSPLLPLLFQDHPTAADLQALGAELFATPDQRALTLFLDAFRQADPALRQQLGASLVALGYEDELEILAGLRCPLAILHGEEEKVVSLDYLQALVAPTLWRHRVHIIPNAGHYAHWEQPESFNELLECFVREVAG